MIYIINSSTLCSHGLSVCLALQADASTTIARPNTAGAAALCQYQSGYTVQGVIIKQSEQAPLSSLSLAYQEQPQPAPVQLPQQGIHCMLCHRLRYRYVGRWQHHCCNFPPRRRLGCCSILCRSRSRLAWAWAQPNFSPVGQLCPCWRESRLATGRAAPAGVFCATDVWT